MTGPEGDRYPTTSIAFSPEGSTFASGSSDQTVRVWDTQTREVLHTLTGRRSLGRGQGAIVFVRREDPCYRRI